MPLGFEERADFHMIEQFAIGDHGNGACFIEDGLLSVRNANNAEAAVRQPNAGHRERAGVVWSAMADDVGHPFKSGDLWLLLTAKFKDASNTTHKNSNAGLHRNLFNGMKAARLAG